MFRQPWLLALALFLATSPPARCADAPPAKDWERLDSCKLLENQSNDGDSFHVEHKGKEYIFRLYFVDAPESEDSFPDRVAEQAAYFGITPQRAIHVGHDAASFSAQKLTGAFTVWTRWKDAQGRSKLPRNYAVVSFGGKDLAEELVGVGLARIYGVRTPLPDGKDSREYLEHLATVEAKAKASGLGGWGSGTAQPASNTAPTSNTGSPKRTDFDSFFKKPNAGAAVP